MVTISTDSSGDKSTDELIGVILNDAYKINGWIASGGMGAVYSGTQLAVDRTVAVKVMHGSLSLDLPSKQRFFREAKLLAEVNHPNVIQLIDFGELESKVPFLVTEFLDGVTLADLIERNVGLESGVLVDFFGQICMAVQAAHRKHLIHRDLKPSNIFIQNDENLPNRVKVLDFGIAKPLVGAGDDQQLTKTGTVVGTPSYISPEQLYDTGEPDPRSDVYSLGAILYFMVAGRPAYKGHSSQAVITKQLTQPPEPIDFEALGKPSALEGIILKAMAMEASDRYASPDALMNDLRKVFTVADTQVSATARQAVSTEETTQAPSAARQWALFLGLLCVATLALLLGGDKAPSPQTNGQAVSSSEGKEKGSSRTEGGDEAEALPEKSAVVGNEKEKRGVDQGAEASESADIGAAPTRRKIEPSKERAPSPSKGKSSTKQADTVDLASQTSKSPLRQGRSPDSCPDGLKGVVGENHFYCENRAGKKSGLEKRWYPDKSKRSEKYFRNGVLDGPWKEWRANGQKRGEGEWRRGKKNGQWRSWSSSGKLTFEGRYKEGAKDGIWSAWYPNGNLKRRGKYIQGKEEGTWSSWHSNGQLKTEGALKNGKKEGLWKSWNPAGELIEELRFSQGQRL